MSLEKNIQDWVSLDNKIKLMHENLRSLRDERGELKELILSNIKRDRLDNVTINISDGSLRFVNTKCTTPLTYKFVKDCLLDFFNDENQCDTIINFMKNKRNDEYKFDIKRYYVN
tara:strand:+ start:199 stop:543 length:345 start_codon:yes stop_codon:yes gene_type:complete